MKNVCIFQTIKIQLEKGHCGVLPVSHPGLMEELETAGLLGASEGGVGPAPHQDRQPGTAAVACRRILQAPPGEGVPLGSPLCR